MSDNPAKEVLSDLFPYLESLETQCAAIMAFLKEKGIATDEQLAPYVEQAKDASNVKWQAARVRMEHLFAAAPELAAKPFNNLPEKAADSRVSKQNKGKDESSASGDKTTPAEEKPVAEAATTQEGDKPAEKKSDPTADNRAKNAGSEVDTTAKTSKPDEGEAERDHPREGECQKDERQKDERQKKDAA